MVPHRRSTRARLTTSAVQDAGDTFGIERPRLVLDHAAPALEEPDKLVLIVKNSVAYGGADPRIQSGAVAAACQHSNSHLLLVLLSNDSVNRIE